CLSLCKPRSSFMQRLLFITGLILFAAPAARADAVRINLFSLFRPQAVEVRVGASEDAALDTDRIAGSRSLPAGCRVRLQLAGGQVQVTVSDAFGHPRQTFTATEARIHAGQAGTLELTLPGKLRRTVRGDLTVAAGQHSLRGALKIV